MVSKAIKISRDVINFVNLEEIEFITNLKKHASDLQNIQSLLLETFQEDHKLLSKKLERSSIKGLLEKYSQFHKDIYYRIDHAYLYKTEIRKTTKEQILCVLARIIIFKKVASHLLEMMRESVAELLTSAKFLKEGKDFQINQIKNIFNIGKAIDKIKGNGREVHSIIEDYCHFIDLVYHLLGDKAELYGKKFTADVYTFQLDCAIRELFFSRTESCDAAAFLIRSRLEVSIRAFIFKPDLTTPTQFIPRENLKISDLLKACRRNGIKFTYPNETLNRIYENLNLVLHFGFKLSPALLWYMFWIASNIKAIIDNSQSAQELFRAKVLKTLEDLEKNGFVEKIESSVYNRPGINILWRY